MLDILEIGMSYSHCCQVTVVLWLLLPVCASVYTIGARDFGKSRALCRICCLTSALVWLREQHFGHIDINNSKL